MKEVEVPRMDKINAEGVIAVGHAGHVYLVQLASGERLWTVALATLEGASGCEGQPVTVGIVGEVILAGSMGHLFAIRLKNGELLWHKQQRVRGSGETNFAFVTPTPD